MNEQHLLKKLYGHLFQTEKLLLASGQSPDEFKYMSGIVRGIEEAIEDVLFVIAEDAQDG